MYKNELFIVCDNHTDLDQFAYRKGHNSTMALLKSQHNWLKWLDGNTHVQYTRTESDRLGYARIRLSGSPMARDLGKYSEAFTEGIK